MLTNANFYECLYVEEGDSLTIAYTQKNISEKSK